MSRVLVAMSGGVDSSVAAKLLVDAGHEVVGATMRLVTNEVVGAAGSNTCCSLRDVEDARTVCERLGIVHHTFDLDDDFTEQVITRWVEAYEAGLTPNPCIWCNRHMKFELLWDLACKLGCDKLATGHYARVLHDPAGGPARLAKARYLEKDQSYVLWPVRQEVLANLILPLGELSSKDEARAIATEAGLVTARKHDSQDICFVPDGDWPAYLDRWRGHPAEVGRIVDADGTVVGWHRGMARYTIGQRKGLGVSAGRRLYVVAKDAATNTVRVGDNDELFSSSFVATDAIWPAGEVPQGPVRGSVVGCYHGFEHACTVVSAGDATFRVECDKSVRAIAPGQSAVVYDGDVVLCGGIIAPLEGVN